MRTWGRNPPDANGYRQWVEVTTDADGYDDLIWCTTLCQVLLLNLGESPFYANFGIPGYQSVMSQVYPDYYVNFTQQQFAPHFATLIISKQTQPPSAPVYLVNITTNQGVKLNAAVPIPT